MKRTIRLLALILTLTLALSAAAMATEIDYGKGETNATKSVSAVSLVKDGCKLKFDGDKLNVTYTNSALKEGDMVIVFLLETKDKDGKITEVKTEEAAQTLIVPTAENIKYIDQSVAKATASNGSVSFDIYPQNHTSALVRIISVNKDGTLTDVNVAAVKLNYTLGDVTGEGEVNAVDALRILQYAANVGNPKYEFSAPWAAGDVDLNGEISGVDAVRILQYAANDGNPKYALGK